MLQVAGAEREAAAGVGAVEERMPVQLTVRQVVLGVVQILFREPRLVRVQVGGLLRLRLLDQPGPRGRSGSWAAAEAVTPKSKTTHHTAASAGLFFQARHSVRISCTLIQSS